MHSQLRSLARLPAAHFVCRRPVALLLVATLSGCAAAAASEAERISRLLDVRAGQTVADVGAGAGEFAVLLAEAVGPHGRVLATEIDEEDLPKIQRRARRADLDNVETLLGGQHDTGLPTACCDAILLRLVYHHFTDPAAMRASLAQALKPGGRLLIIETDVQRGWNDLDGVPDRGGHGIPREELLQELAPDFKVLEQIEKWSGGEGDPFAVLVSPRRQSSQATRPGKMLKHGSTSSSLVA